MVRVGIFLVIGAFAHGGLADEGVLEKERADVMRRKLEATVLPEVVFKDPALSDGLAELTKLSLQNDPWAAGEEKSGVILRKRPGTEGAPVSMELRDVPLIEVLRYVAELSGTTFRVTKDGAEFDSAADGEMEMGLFQMPPSFEEYRRELRPGEAVDPFAPVEWVMDRPLRSARWALTKMGIELADGDSVSHFKGKLFVRSSPKNLRMVERIVADLQKRSPPVIRMQLDLYEMDNVDASEIVGRSLKKSASGAELEAARVLAEKGKARLIGVPALMTTSGQRAKVKSGKSVAFISRYEAEEGKDVPVWEEFSHGTSLEVDPAIGSDGITVDVHVAIEMRFGEPKLVMRKVRLAATGRELEVEIYSYDERWISTSVTTLSGQTQLIGSLSPSAEDGKTVLAFLTVGITRALPEKK